MNSTTHRHTALRHRDEDGRRRGRRGWRRKKRAEREREKNREETEFRAKFLSANVACFKAEVCTERAAACAYTCARLSLAIEIWPTSSSTRFADTGVLYPSKSTDRDAPIDIRGASQRASALASARRGWPLCGARDAPVFGAPVVYRAGIWSTSA